MNPQEEIENAITDLVKKSEGTLDRDKARQIITEQVRIAEANGGKGHPFLDDEEDDEARDNAKPPGGGKSLAVLKGAATKARNAANANPGDAALEQAAKDAEAAVAAAQA